MFCSSKSRAERVSNCEYVCGLLHTQQIKIKEYLHKFCCCCLHLAKQKKNKRPWENKEQIERNKNMF